MFRCFLILILLAPAVRADDAAGKWRIRIDGGGEIYTAQLAISKGEQGLAGTYESDGRRVRLQKVSVKGSTLTVVVNTQRFSTPVVATFVADIDGNSMAGEVDFNSGSRSRAYDFVGKRLGGSTVAAKAPKESDNDKNNTVASGPVTRSFRNGVDGYKGALDAEIWAIAPSKSLLKQGTMTTDGNNGGGESQVLLRFEQIFGEGKNQIPPGARISNAQLTVVAFDPGTTCYLHRILVPWSPAVTWDGMANGITVDNSEASTVRDGFTFAEINMDKQLVYFNVTPTVQLWADGVENYGWVFINTGGNGWDFYSSDWIESEFRPMLEVTYTQPSGASKTISSTISSPTTVAKGDAE